MSLFSLKEYSLDDKESWDSFIKEANNGTTFHRLDFLSYHGDKFKDNEHPIAWYKGQSLFGTLPLLIENKNGKKIAKSPYGASWGGLAHRMKFKLKYALKMVEGFIAYLKEMEVQKCYLTLSPTPYWKEYTNFFEFALCNNGFEIKNRELTHMLCLIGSEDAMNLLTSSARTQTRKAIKNNIKITRNADIEDLYPIILENKKRLGASESDITHSIEDIKIIQNINPEFIKIDIATLKNEVIAGNLYIDCGDCLLSFYPSIKDGYQKTSALNLVIKEALQWSIENNYRYFDFGTSSENMTIKNPGLSKYKESFGANGYFRDTYEWINEDIIDK